MKKRKNNEANEKDSKKEKKRERKEERKKERKKDRQADRQTDRHTDKKKERNREKERKRHNDNVKDIDNNSNNKNNHKNNHNNRRSLPSHSGCRKQVLNMDLLSMNTEDVGNLVACHHNRANYYFLESLIPSNVTVKIVEMKPKVYRVNWADDGDLLFR